MKNANKSNNNLIHACKSNFKVKEIGLRPGEKLHEDMLAETELPFTKEVSSNLLAVLPQYTHKSHSYENSYTGLEFNSSLHLSQNVDDLVGLIEFGLEIAN